MTTVPYERELGTLMSNFDHSIAAGSEELLRAEDAFALYAGWEFNARVWFERESRQFACEVWRYRSPVQIYRADSLEEIMEDVSDDWGWE